MRDKLENLEEQMDKLQEHLDKMEVKLEKIINEYDNKEYNFELNSYITRMEDLINNSLTKEIKYKESINTITESSKLGYFSCGILIFLIVHIYCLFIHF